MQARSHVPEYQLNFNQWQRIQQQDAIFIMHDLQNQMGTSLETIRCFQNTVPSLRIDDKLLREIKRAANEVTGALDLMRTRLRAISLEPKHHIGNERLYNLPPIAANMRLAPISFIPVVQAGELHRQRTLSYPGITAIGHGTNLGTFETHNGSHFAQRSAHRAQPPPGFSSILSPNASERSSNDDLGCSPVRVESPKTRKLEFSALEPEDGEVFHDSAGDRAPRTNGATTNGIPLPTPKPVSKTPQHQNGREFPNQESRNDPSPKSKPIVNRESASTPVSPNRSTESMGDRGVLAAEISSHDFVPSPGRDSRSLFDREIQTISGEALQLVHGETSAPDSKSTCQAAENLESTPFEGKISGPTCSSRLSMSREGSTEPESSLRELQEKPLLRTEDERALHTAVQTNSCLESARASNQLPLFELEANECLELWSNDGSDTIVNISSDAGTNFVNTPVESPALAAEPSPTRFESTSRSLPNEISSDLETARIAARAERLSLLELPSVASTHAVPQTENYRSCRTSTQSNGSIDGFTSPVPSEPRTLSNVDKLGSQLHEIDELARSLEKRWSLSEPGSEMEVRSTPKSGLLPIRIEEYRFPPPLKHVPAVVSSCSEEGDLFVQLMEDEASILDLDPVIEKCLKTPPLKFSEVQPGDFVLCLYEVDKQYYRAQLLRARGEDKFEVRFVDYGNRCITSVKNMRKLPAIARRLPQFAVKCEFSADLQPNAETLKKSLQAVSVVHHFIACFGETHKEKEREAPLFTLIDIQTMNGMRLIQLPPKTIIGPANAKFLVRNLEFKALGMIILDLVEDLSRKLAIDRRMKELPTLQCKMSDVKVGTLVMYKSQRAMITRVEPNALVSLELIDELQQGLLRHVSVEECCFMPLTVVNVPPAPSRIVCLHKDQDWESAEKLCKTEALLEMTVVETDATPQVKFAAAPSDAYHGDKQVII